MQKTNKKFTQFSYKKSKIINDILKITIYYNNIS